MERSEKTALARRLAANGIVLLKNDGGALPLAKGETVVLAGFTGYHCHRMGWGSGDMMNHPPVQYDAGLERAGIRLDAAFAALYRAERDKRLAEGKYDRTNLDWGRWTARFDEPDLPDAKFDELARGKRGEKCIVVIGRSAGESEDIREEPGGFRLHWQEENLIRAACRNFETVIVLLNACGVIDTSFMEKHPVKALVHTSLLGEVSGDAVADVLTGRVTPSGKTSDTWARHYYDYPSTDCFQTMEIPYREGVFVGYRHFTSFGIEPRYPFGFGLSYTTFALERRAPEQIGAEIVAKVTVRNTGAVAGAETVQGYLESSVPGDPRLRLVAFRKSRVLGPGESQDLELRFNLRDAATYDEESASWVLRKGTYAFCSGNSSRIEHRSAIRVSETIVFEKTANRFPKAEFRPVPCLPPAAAVATCEGPVLTLDAKPFANAADTSAPRPAAKPLAKPAHAVTMDDVLKGKATLEDLAAQFDDDELGLILNGRIFDEGFRVAGGTGVGGTKTGKVKNEAGEFWSSEKYGLPAVTCADGPSGIRLGNFGDPITNFNPQCAEMVQWPCGTALAQGWDPAAAEEFGRAVADDMARGNVDGWLAPGMNIHRNPLCGRNFEYFSEDPLLAGRMGAAVVRGVQTRADGSSSGRYATIKHFCTNGQEFQRGAEMNLVAERALREIYLRPFEIAVKEGRPLCLMTSYNQLNGDYAATTRALVSDILRGEWGFDGLVMTDWWNAADKLRHPHSGNDVVMPGVRREVEALIAAIKAGKVDRAEAQAAAVNVLKIVRNKLQAAR